MNLFNSTKRIMKKILILILLGASFGYLQAQNESDALRLSQLYYQGTARSMAMGGAFGALGADFSSLSTNPAGLGLYRMSEMSITPEVFSRKTESTYNGMYGMDSRTIFDLSNIGLVTTTKAPESKTSMLKYYQFAMGMNRTANYNNASYIIGDNQDNSKVDIYLDQIGNTSPENIESEFPFDLYPAWYVYILDTARDAQGLYYTSPVPQGGIRQEESQITKGSNNEWLFAASANLNDFIFVGATMGLPYTRYFKSSTFTEFDNNENIPGFEQWSYSENIETHGWGVNLKLGVIVIPIEWLRLGASFHTPTLYYGMHDSWYTSTESRLNGVYNRKDSPSGNYEYDITTPLRAMGSAALIVGKVGLFSVDYEFVDYRKAKLDAFDYNFMEENNAIRTNYASASILRMGTEWRYTNISLRGGYSIYGSPYANGDNLGTTNSYSLGLGYQEKEIGIDFAWVHGNTQQNYYLYSSENFTTNATVQNINRNNFVLTIKTRF